MVSDQTGFYEELEDFLSNEWIKVADACAIFAGWVPLEDYVPSYSFEGSYGPRDYLRLEDGARINPGAKGFKEIRRIQKKWKGSDWRYTTRHPYTIDKDSMNEEIRVCDAFRIGLAMKLDRVATLLDKACEYGILDRKICMPTERQSSNEPRVGIMPEQAEIQKSKHKFEIGLAKAPMSKILATWLSLIREQGENAPEGGADRFLLWFADVTPATPFVEIECVTKDAIKYWNINDKGEHTDSSAKIYDKNQINIQIKRLCGLK